MEGDMGVTEGAEEGEGDIEIASAVPLWKTRLAQHT